MLAAAASTFASLLAGTWVFWLFPPSLVGPPQWSADDALLAYGQGHYSRTSSANCRDLFLIPSAGGELRHFPPHAPSGCASDPAWAPRGRLFGYYGGGDAPGLVVASPDAPAGTRLAPASQSRPSWSPDGTRIAFSGADELVHVVRVDGADDRVLQPGKEAEWSPDGTRIAYEQRDGTLWVMNADGSGARRLSDRPCGSRPSWSPDARHLVSAAPRCSLERPPSVVVFDADTGARTVLADAGDEPAWSPDGTRIAYSSRDGIVAARPDGTAPAVVADYGQSPTWSHDSKRIAFAGPGGEGEVYVAAADGSGVRSLTGDCHVTPASPPGYMCILPSGTRQSVPVRGARRPLRVELYPAKLDRRIWSRPCRCDPHHLYVEDARGNRVRNLRVTLSAGVHASFVFTRIPQHDARLTSAYGRIPFRIVARPALRALHPPTLGLEIVFADEAGRRVAVRRFQLRLPARPN